MNAKRAQDLEAQALEVCEAAMRRVGRSVSTADIDAAGYILAYLGKIREAEAIQDADHWTAYSDTSDI